MNPRTWLARHAQTLVGSLGGIMQHPVASLMTMAVIAVALALPLALGIFLQNVRGATANWNQAFDISVYMDKKAASGRTQTLAKQIRSRADVAGVRIVTAGDALLQFRNASGFGEALDALNDNPLPDTLVVTPTPAASTPDGMAALETALSAASDVQLVQSDTEWIKRMHAAMDIFRRIVEMAGALLGLGVVLVVGNTIRLDILNRQAEIEVMKLVGATDGFARRPFLYSGIWYGLGGGMIAVILIETAIAVLSGPVARLAALYGSQFHLRGLEFGSGMAVLASAVGLSWLGSWLAATRHIRRIEPS